MRFAVVVGAVAMACAAVGRADTVAWWHLDEVAVSNTVPTAAASRSVFKNVIDPSKHAAYGTGTANSSWSAIGPLPFGDSAFPAGAKYLDPITGQWSENARCVHIKRRLKADDYPADNASICGAIVIPGNDELTPDSFTYELFVKPDERTDTDQCFLAIEPVSETRTSGVWAFYDHNKVGFTTFYAKEDGSVEKTTQSKSVSGICNGRWHHFALTYDKSSSTMTLWLDYAPYVTRTDIPADFTMKGLADIGLGNKKSGNGVFASIDEFRISDKALQPGEFLSVIEADDDLQMYPETAVYQRFTPFPDFFGVQHSLLRNEAPDGFSLGVPTVVVYGDGYQAIEDVPVANVSTGAVGRADGTVNRAAVVLRSNETSRDWQAGGWTKESLPRTVPCWKFTDTNAAVSTNDVTVEMFFRTTNVVKSTYFAALGLPAWRIMANGNNNGINVNDKTVYKASIADGKWHHLAFVADATTKKGRVYLDYVLCTNGDVSDGEVAMGTGDMDPQECIGIGCYGSETSVTFFDIDLDDIRITRRKLSIGEFLHENRNDGVIVDQNFDQQDDLRHAFLTGITKISNMVGWGTQSYDADDKPGETVAEGIFAEKATANVSSRQNVGGSGRDGNYYLRAKGDEIASLTADDFTVEYDAKFPVDAYKDYLDNAAYMLYQPKAAADAPIWQISFTPVSNATMTAQNTDAGLLKFATAYDGFGARPPASAWADGEWHHYAYVYDKEMGEVRAYFDYALQGASSIVLVEEARDEIYLGTGGWKYTLGMHTWGFDNFRITKKALAPKDFLTSKRVVAGDTLVWAPFDRTGDIVSPIEGTTNFSGTAWAAGAGQLVDKDEQPIAGRGRNKGALAGGGAYPRLSLLEIPDFTAEFFVKDANKAASGTDLVGLMGADGVTPIWSVRKGSDGNLHVFVTPQGGTLTDLGSFGAASEGWTHVAVVFEPAADASETTVRVYVGYDLVGSETFFDGTLAVQGLSTSALTCGAFGGAIDELRIVKGTLSADDMLRALRLGFTFFLK